METLTLDEMVRSSGLKDDELKDALRARMLCMYQWVEDQIREHGQVRVREGEDQVERVVKGNAVALVEGMGTCEIHNGQRYLRLTAEIQVS